MTQPRLWGIALVTFGALLLSFDALLIRLSQAEAGAVVFWRGGFMALALGLAAAWPGRRTEARWRWRDLLGIALLMGLDNALFVVSILHTEVANTVVILSASPLFAAFFSWWLLGEVMPARTWLAIVVALGGVLLVFAGSLDSGHWLGDLSAFAAACALGANLTLLRGRPKVSRLPAVALSGVFMLLLSLPFAAPLQLLPGALWVLGLMGLVQLPLGRMLLAVGPRYLPAAEVSLLMFLQTALAPMWVWWLLGEAPRGATVLGGVVIFLTLAWHSWWSLRRVRDAADGAQ